ncbi:MAG: hypothetical protein ACI8UO_000846 [Verrucomicrobiales bacterium]|jgi:hypothetical protein
MLGFGSFKANDCAGNTRRNFIKTAAAVPFTLASGNQLLSAAQEAQRNGHVKSVIVLWLWGGPSHIDTFDPKPDAPMEYRGPFGTIPTKTPGMHFTELLPRMAARSDKFTVIRSMQTTNGGHPGAGTVGLTGYEENAGPIQPNFGAIVAKDRGANEALPPFFYVGRGIPRDLPRRIEGYGGGTLGKAYDPFLVSASERGEVSIPSLTLLDGITPDRIQKRQQLLDQLDSAERRLEGAGIDEWRRTHQSAYGLLADPEARKAFDLTQESDGVRSKYGQSTFGQGCLLARRLAEAEVPYIQVNWSEYVETFTPNGDFGWDTHIFNFELLQDRHCPILDRAYSALIDDLEDRGMLDSTLIVTMGEFGRTPKISNRAAREHHQHCYFSIWAGGGVEPGRVIGESDEKGERPITRPITPLMVGTTIAELSGIGAKKRAEMKVLDGGSVIHELV